MAFSLSTSSNSLVLFLRLFLAPAADTAPFAGVGGAMGTLSTLGALFPCGGALGTRGVEGGLDLGRAGFGSAPMAAAVAAGLCRGPLFLVFLGAGSSSGMNCGTSGTSGPSPLAADLARGLSGGVSDSSLGLRICTEAFLLTGTGTTSVSCIGRGLAREGLGRCTGITSPGSLDFALEGLALGTATTSVSSPVDLALDGLGLFTGTASASDSAREGLGLACSSASSAMALPGVLERGLGVVALGALGALGPGALVALGFPRPKG
jgi:hypothetical protein